MVYIVHSCHYSAFLETGYGCFFSGFFGGLHQLFKQCLHELATLFIDQVAFAIKLFPAVYDKDFGFGQRRYIQVG